MGRSRSGSCSKDEMITSFRFRFTCLLVLCLAALVLTGCAEDGALLPGKFTLRGPFARQQLILEKMAEKQFVGQITNGVIFSASNPKVVRIEADVAAPA